MDADEAPGRCVILERMETGLYQLHVSHTIETDGWGLLNFSKAVQRILTDGKGQAIYVIRFGDSG